MHKNPNDSHRQHERWFRGGTALLHQGKAARAVPLLEKAYALNPAHVDTAVNLSGAYILTNKFRLAEPILETLAEVQPDNAMIWTNLGAAYLGNPILAREEQQLKAIAAFEQALAADPNAPHVAYNIGLIYRDRGENEKAVHWFKQAVQTNPLDTDAEKLIHRLEQKES